jgi:hypothetical protein
MQPWHRWREPLAIVLLVALGLLLAVRGVAVGLTLAAGNTGGFYGGIPGGDDLLLLAAAGAVLWCTVPLRDSGTADRPPAPSPHAWPIALAGMVVVGLTVLGWFVLAVANVVAMVSWPTPDVGFVLLVAEAVLRLVLPVAALVAVVLAVRRAAPAREAAEAAAALPTPGPDVPAVTAAPTRLPAAWQADEATGAVWLTADDAAQGQPGLSWSDPAPTPGAVTSGSWVPAAPPSDEPVAPAAAAEDDDLR